MKEMFLFLTMLIVLSFALRAAIQIRPADKPEHADKIIIHIVQPGDTLWGLATSRKGNYDRRKWIDAVRKINDNLDANLQIGQRLRLVDWSEMTENLQKGRNQ